MWTVITRAASDWLRHHDARLGAALAYYSVFSLGPLLLIVVSIAGLFFGGDAVREALTGQFRSLLGPTGSQAVEAMLKGAGSTGSGVLSGIVLGRNFPLVLLLVMIGALFWPDKSADTEEDMEARKHNGSDHMPSSLRH